MIIDRLSVFVKWKFWKQLKKDSLQKGCKNYKKGVLYKQNWKNTQIRALKPI